MKAIAAVLQEFKWREVVLIHEDTTYGTGIIPYAINIFQELGIRFVHISAISSFAEDFEISKELKTLITLMQTRVFLVHMTVSIGSRLFELADKAGMMSKGYVWLITDGMSNSLDAVDLTTIEGMKGVLGIRPYVPKSKDLENFGKRWTRNLQLMNANRLSGEFELVNGKLQQSTFEVFNMIGQGQNVVGYWTQDKGLSRNLGSTKRSTLSNSSKLKNIIWPGHSIKIPKGWNIPKLKVGIPKNEGFTQFVEIQRNPYTNETKCTGFSCDVFLATLDALDFEVPCEFVPFMNAEGRSAGTYDELLYQIEDKKVDIVVGDTTIVANRTSYVDFTLPYSESGVTMLVPIKRDKRKNMWIFLRPWSWDLWLAVVMYSIFTGIAIRIIEHGTPNTEFQGSTTRQVGMVLYFPLSSLVVPQGKLVSKYSQFVLIIWLCLAYILLQSYTASLSSILTIDRLKPSFVSVDELKTKRYSVGYQYGSFVRNDLLLNKLKFNESKLVPYHTIQEYHNALSKGSENGGVAAIFDEIPYAFPLESRLVSYFSRAILRVRENKTLDDIEKRYFAHELTSQSDNADPSLDVYSFGGLFIITGVATLFALFISQSWLWQKPVAMAKEYTQKYLASYSPNNTEEIVIQSTTGNEMNVTEQSSVPEVESTSENLTRMSNLQIDENVSAEQAK
ncbi:hypothetical protein Pint_14223 [Pistacia integerrima]|uniref:Uncharacterized protein n=1 Tax=Pistacia integerrima TaxID=434235 RepID=A0ACC0Y7G7_9ROSI|nr:hypothetical protein Pint_14223 [Pistacia integerrima]